MDASSRFAVVDVETSGLSPKRHRLLQVAVVVVRADGTVEERWSSYVRPRWWRLAHTGPTRLHGITRRHLRDGQPLAAVLEQLSTRVDGAVLVAHNAAFDAEFLRRGAVRTGVRLAWAEELCTLGLSRRLDADRALSHHLADVCARYGITVDRPHDALADAEATAALLPHLLVAHGLPRSAGPGAAQLDDVSPR